MMTNHRDHGCYAHQHCLEICLWHIYYFFFFQAEDGIRDRDVTGVQTCALPISHRFLDGDDCVLRERVQVTGDLQFGAFDAERSEERRVGKECRSGWSP